LIKRCIINDAQKYTLYVLYNIFFTVFTADNIHIFRLRYVMHVYVNKLNDLLILHEKNLYNCLRLCNPVGAFPTIYVIVLHTWSTKW